MELDVANLIKFVVCSQWAVYSFMIGLKQVVEGGRLSKYVLVSLLWKLNELIYGKFKNSSWHMLRSQ